MDFGGSYFLRKSVGIFSKLVLVEAFCTNPTRHLIDIGGVSGAHNQSHLPNISPTLHRKHLFDSVDSNYPPLQASVEHRRIPLASGPVLLFTNDPKLVASLQPWPGLYEIPLFVSALKVPMRNQFSCLVIAPPICRRLSVENFGAYTGF